MSDESASNAGGGGAGASRGSVEANREDAPKAPNAREASKVRSVLSDGVLTVTLADVENRNALGGEVVAGLREAIARANADAGIRVVVVTNEGSTFCAGANLKQRSSESGKANPAPGSGGFPELLAEIQRSPTPIVGRIDGHVVGGGNGLASAFDVSVAREDVKFGFTEVRLGVTPAIISVVCLPKMRQGEAMEVFLRGHRFSGARAAELGLINRAVPGEALDAAVADVVADLRKGGPNALGIAKSLVYRVPTMDQQEAFEWTAKLSNECFASDEAKEGMQAFLEKRSTRWADETG